MNEEITLRNRILGGLWGSVVGDALGVPVEFRSREEVRANPVVGMRGYGSHNQPPGTWSDDSSLMISTIVSLMNSYDLQELGLQFARWLFDAEWTAHGKVFDVGGATADALHRIRRGVPANEAGCDDEYSNGNGSLMRMLPVPLMFAGESTDNLLERVHDVSAVTHGHRRSKMVCGQYGLMVRELLQGAPALDAYRSSTITAANHYGGTDWKDEFLKLRTLLGGEINDLPEEKISSGGYVVDTLTASIWCVLREETFSDAVRRAVNLGGDTDTTGCVTGALAGVLHGFHAIPSDWINALARREDLQAVFEKFADKIERQRNG